MGRNQQPALPSFLMQFANGCEDAAKPERGRSRGAGGMQDVEQQHCGTREPARTSVAQLW